MDEDEDDFIFYGTPIEREEETSARKRKAAADAGQLRSLPAWKQEVRDEEGRRRFHGAFTGGFSAGYYNTAGSKEGWTPQTFTSSRKNRAEVKQQTIYHFLDDDDIKDMGGHALETSMQFDTFGFTAAEYARKQAQKEQEKRPSAIPGPAPDDIVLPASHSIGMKLLQKMGWRRGHSIRETQAESLYYARREARKALLAFSGNVGEPDVDQLEASRSASEELSERCNYDLNNLPSTPAYVFNQKKDLHGLGYDPFKHAPEFRDRKGLYESRTKVQDRRKYAPGFGIGALEELDIEDEDIYAYGFELEETEVEEVEPTRMIKDNTKLVNRKQGVLSGFKVASNPEYSLERFHPPLIPSDFKPVHKFRSPPEPANKLPEAPPQEVPPPEDNNLKLLIDGFATLVARCGKLFEDISKEKHKSNPLFAFLTGGNGYGYYERKLWEEKQRHVDQPRLMDMKSVSSTPKLTAESRGRILGERPLEKSTESSSFVASKEVIHLQSNLSDTFTKSSSLVRQSESAKPFNNDPAKQERFEQFLKDKYQGGLRSTLSGSGGKLSEAERARERLDFEAAAEAMEKGELHVKDNIGSVHQVLDLARSGDMQFIPSSGTEKRQISQHEEKMASKICPKREEFQWRPSPILCKRFDISDPFMGKPAPLPRPRSRMDTLIFTTDSAQNVQPQKTDSDKRHTIPLQPKIPEKMEIRAEVADDEPTPTSAQRPVDLYKAIFSDDSDDEGANIIANANKGDDPEKKTEGANKTLNRLIAGDFLESLGKELGLEVPSDTNGALHRTNTPSLMDIDGGGEHKVPSKNEVSTFQKSDMVSGKKELIISTSKIPEIATMSVSSSIPREVIEEIGSSHADSRRLRSNSSQGRAEEAFSDHEEDKAPSEKRKHHRTDRHKTHSRHHRRSSDSDSDTSSDHGHYDCSKSRADKRSSEGRNHSKHHKSKRRRSRSRSRYYTSDDDRDRDCKHERSKERKPKDDAASDALHSKRYGPRKHH